MALMACKLAQYQAKHLAHLGALKVSRRATNLCSTPLTECSSSVKIVPCIVKKSQLPFYPAHSAIAMKSERENCCLNCLELVSSAPIARRAEYRLNCPVLSVRNLIVMQTKNNKAITGKKIVSQLITYPGIAQILTLSM